MNMIKLNPKNWKELTVSTFLAIIVACGSPLSLAARTSSPSINLSCSVFTLPKIYHGWFDCDCVKQKANRRLYALRSLRPKSGVHPDDIVFVYCKLVRSVLEYAAAAFADLPNYLANDMEKIQKRALWAIYLFTSYEDTLVKAVIASLKQSRKDACVTFCKKNLSWQPNLPFNSKQDCSLIFGLLYTFKSIIYHPTV